MRRIPKDQEKEIDTQIDVCAGAAKDLEEAIDAYNAAVADAKGKVEQALADYNESVRDLRELYEPLHTDASDFLGERSEKYQESDKGQEYQRWIDALNDPGVNEVEMEMPAELELPDDIPDWSTPGDFLPANSPDEQM